MNSQTNPLSLNAVSRRQVMIGAAGLSFAVALGRIDAADAAVTATEVSGKALSPWVAIAPDGTITIMSPATEMGQGSMTSLPRVLAEELDADWDKVRVVPAPTLDAVYGNPGFGGMMYTAGSNAVRSYYRPLRIFGAQVRRVLMDNAAKKWSFSVAELTTEPSAVVHASSGRRLSYGEIAVFAEVPAKAPELKPDDLKKPSQFRLIGKDQLRVEVPMKVNGTAKYGIDVQVPGMLYATLIEATYTNDYAYHAQMEPLNAVASVSLSRNSAEIWCGTQSQTMAQEAVAKVLGIPRANVKLHDLLMGGGFGRRGHRDEEFIVDAVEMAKEAGGKPVKVLWTGEDDVKNGRFRPLSAHHVRAGLDKSGKIVAMHQRIAVDRVLPFADPVGFASANMRDGIVMRGVELNSY